MTSSNLRRRTLRTLIGSAVPAAITALAALALSPAPAAWAHQGPKPGTACAMDGMTVVRHAFVYRCVGTDQAHRPVWSTGTATTSTPLTMSDAWAKAARRGQMSAAFGTLRNPSSQPIRVVAALSPASPAIQLHEVVMSDGKMVMQQRVGGFVVPAHGSITLAPGGNHLMLMSLGRTLTAGTTPRLTLVTADGGLVTVRPLVKVFHGGNESYERRHAR